MAVVRTEAYFNSSTGCNKIHTVIWKDDNLTPIGVFQIAHGMAEHIERYDDFARFLCANGYVVCGNDHLGHGKSVNDESQLGHFADNYGDKRLVDDMHILTRIMKKKYSQLPYFLFGHSMGSLCARVYTVNFGNELNGVIYCGTGEAPSVASALQVPVDALCFKLGSRTKVDFFGDVFNAVSNLMIPEKDSPVAWISEDKENQINYQNDKLCGFALSLGGYRDVFALLNDCSRKEWASEVPENLPIMVISGALDPVGFNGKGVLTVADNLVLAGHEPTVILYPGDRHEILNESDKEKVYKDILAWLNSTYIS